MSDSDKPIENEAIGLIGVQLSQQTHSKRRQIIEKFVLAALGSIPWVGGVLSATASLKTDNTDQLNNLRTQWLDEHARKIEYLKGALEEILQRFEKIGERIDERIQSESYLTLVRRAFRVWDQADTKEKQQYVASLVTNAAGTTASSDDVIRLFIDWLNNYHESHFLVIREIFKNPGATRYDIWTGIHKGTPLPMEDSAEADLFKLLIRDLSTGGVIRQERETNALHQFVRQRPPNRRTSASSTLESAFEDSKPYVLTELGKQFVHYTMNEAVSRISDAEET